MTETVPERIHVRWGKSGDVRVTYMDERFWPPDAEADYVPATALEAAHNEIERLRKALTEAADELDAYYSQEYSTDHPYHVLKLAVAKSGNVARAALEGK